MMYVPLTRIPCRPVMFRSLLSSPTGPSVGNLLLSEALKSPCVNNMQPQAPQGGGSHAALLANADCGGAPANRTEYAG